jgi:hypothetical protein
MFLNETAGDSISAARTHNDPKQLARRLLCHSIGLPKYCAKRKGAVHSTLKCALLASSILQFVAMAGVFIEITLLGPNCGTIRASQSFYLGGMQK